MAVLDLWGEVFFSNWRLLIVSVVVATSVVLLVIRKRTTPSKRAEHTSSPSRCASPSCARCHGEMEIRDRLQLRLEEYVKNTHSIEQQDVATRISEQYSRILSTIESYDRKDEVVTSAYRKSGYEDVPSKYFGHIWTMPGLRESPIWSFHDHSAMWQMYSMFEDVENFQMVAQEFEGVSKHENGWKYDSIATGSWKTYFLINQGEVVQENADRCPKTVHLLKSTGCLMTGSTFGNAFFSVLRPGSRIEPHTAPCNFRLRCHLAINASSGFYIRVGTCTTSWTTGRLLVFDDAFVHTVWHEEQQASSRERVMLIFDIWHPDITPHEQQALSYLYKNP